MGWARASVACNQGGHRDSLLKRLRSETTGCDLFSAGEYEAAIRAGFAPQAMSLGGNGKLADPHFIDRLVRDGARITVDEIGELDAIERAAAAADAVVPIRLRMRPDLDGYWASSEFLAEPLPTHIATQAYKAGLPTADLLEAGRRVIDSAHMELTGLHVHFGRHRSATAYWRAAGRATAAEIVRCLDAWPGWTPHEIDLGGGFAGPGDRVGQDASLGFTVEAVALHVLRLLPRRAREAAAAAVFRASRRRTPEDHPQQLPPSMDDYAEAVVGELARGLAGRIDPAQVVLEVEPGRGIYADAGSHLARVLGVKRQSAPLPWTWVVTDTSTSFLSDAEAELCRFAVRVEPDAPDDGTEVVDITGMSCNADRIVGDVRVPRGLALGDLVVFEATGAYNEQAASNFNSLPRPASVLVDDAGAHLMRRRETIDDVLARDIDDAGTAAQDHR